jgi:hypothetical protein
MVEAVIKAKLGAIKETIRLNGSKYQVQFGALEAALNAQLVALRENTALAFSASEKAIQKAEAATEKRFESVNEFRKTLTDQTATFMPRAQTEALLANLNEKIGDLVARIERNEGRSSGVDRTIDRSKTNYHLIIAGVAGLLTLGSMLFAVFMALRAH